MKRFVLALSFLAFTGNAFAEGRCATALSPNELILTARIESAPRAKGKWSVEVLPDGAGINLTRTKGKDRDLSLEESWLPTFEKQIQTMQPTFIRRAKFNSEINNDFVIVLRMPPTRSFEKDGVVQYRVIHGRIEGISYWLVKGKEHESYQIQVFSGDPSLPRSVSFKTEDVALVFERPKSQPRYEPPKPDVAIAVEPQASTLPRLGESAPTGQSPATVDLAQTPQRRIEDATDPNDVVSKAVLDSGDGAAKYYTTRDLPMYSDGFFGHTLIQGRPAYSTIADFLNSGQALAARQRMQFGVFDSGTGSGRAMNDVLTNYPDAKVTALDANQTSNIAVIKSTYKRRFDFLRMFLETLLNKPKLLEEHAGKYQRVIDLHGATTYSKRLGDALKVLLELATVEGEVLFKNMLAHVYGEGNRSQVPMRDVLSIKSNGQQISLPDLLRQVEGLEVQSWITNLSDKEVSNVVLIRKTSAYRGLPFELKLKHIDDSVVPPIRAFEVIWHH